MRQPDLAFFNPGYDYDWRQPEFRLLDAMLKRAILDYTGMCESDETNKPNRGSAIEWIWSESTKPFTFVWTCDLLNYDVESLRRTADKIASWRKSARPLPSRLGTLSLETGRRKLIRRRGTLDTPSSDL